VSCILTRLPFCVGFAPNLRAPVGYFESECRFPGADLWPVVHLAQIRN